MAITFTLPNIGLRQKLGALADYLNAASAFALFTAPTSISDTLNVAAITQATFPGYAAQTNPVSVVTGSNTNTMPSVSCAPVTFTCTATFSPAQTVQGVYCLLNVGGALGTELLALALMPGGPQVISQPGDSIVAQLTLTDQRAPGQP